MREYMKARGLWFFDANDDGKSGGGSAGDSSTVGQGDKIDLDALFKTLPLDELDDDTRKKFETAKTALGTSVATLQTNLEKTVQQARDFQSQKDTFQRQLDELKRGAQSPKDDDYLTAVKDAMAKNGYTADVIAKQAPVFAEMLKSAGGVIRKEVGTGLQPMAQSVIEQTAKDAFAEAQDRDEVGCLGIPEVAEKVWGYVKERITNGATTNADIVLNLAKMAYVDFVSDTRKAGKAVPELQPRTEGNRVSGTTPFTYPGAGRGSGGIPLVRQASDPNGPKHALNADTEAALKSTVREMGRGMEFKKKPPVLANE